MMTIPLSIENSNYLLKLELFDNDILSYRVLLIFYHTFWSEIRDSPYLSIVIYRSNYTLFVSNIMKEKQLKIYKEIRQINVVKLF